MGFLFFISDCVGMGIIRCLGSEPKTWEPRREEQQGCLQYVAENLGGWGARHPIPRQAHIPRPGPALGRVFPRMISRAGRWAVARHAIEMSSTEWSLIFSSQAQFLKRIKVKDSLRELALKATHSFDIFTPLALWHQLPK